MGALDKLGPRGLAALRVVGWIALALVAFVMALQLTFPYDRVKDKLAEAMASRYDMKVTRVERGWLPGKMILHGVTLADRPTHVGEVPPVMFIDKLEVDVGVLALVRGVAAIDVDATIGDGHLRGTLELARSGNHIDLTASNLQADALPMLRDAVAGLPLFGRIDGVVRLDLTPDFKKTSGALQLACARGCAIGDGKTRFKPKVANAKSAAMLGDGIDFGTVNIDRWLARVEFKDGKADLARWEFESPDTVLDLDLHLRLGRTLSDSEVAAGCLKFKGTEALSKREPKTAAALTTTGGVMDTAGLFNIKLEGKFGELKKRPRLCTAAGADDPTGGATTPDGKIDSRPALSKQPGDDTGAPGPGDDVFAKGEPTTGVPVAAPTAPVIDAAPAPTPTVIDAAHEEHAEPVPPPPSVEPAVDPAADPAAPPAPEEPEPVPAPPE